MRQAELSLKDISEHQMFLSALEARAQQLTHRNLTRTRTRTPSSNP